MYMNRLKLASIVSDRYLPNINRYSPDSDRCPADVDCFLPDFNPNLSDVYRNPADIDWLLPDNSRFLSDMNE